MLSPTHFRNGEWRVNYNQAAKEFLHQKQKEGYETSIWNWILRRPGKMPPGAMLEMANSFNCEIGDLLSAGIGRLNTYDEIQQLVNHSGRGEELGVVLHVA
ncbi:MAG: hypothetical protein AAFU67_16855 [Bacteroidota bacterium]